MSSSVGLFITDVVNVAPIIVPSEASSDSNNDAEELLRQLRGLLDEFRRLIVSLEAALR